MYWLKRENIRNNGFLFWKFFKDLIKKYLKWLDNTFKQFLNKCA